MALFCLPDWRVHISVPGVGPLRIRIRRNRSFWLRDPLTHERYPLAILKAFIRPTDTVWDVGANLGLYSRFIISRFHAAQAVAFEPMSENLPELAYNLRLGGIGDRVIVKPWALSNVDGEVEFQIDDVQSVSGALDSVCNGQASPGRKALGLPPRIERVVCRSLDKVLDERAVPAPQVIKVDIEGAEDLFLEGATSYLNAIGARLLIEIHGVASAKNVLRRLLEMGYQVCGKVPTAWHARGHMRLYRMRWPGYKMITTFTSWLPQSKPATCRMSWTSAISD